MKGYYIEITNNLLDPKHCSAMGQSVWLFMWFLDKMTSISEAGVGKVLGGVPIKFERVEDDLGISLRTYQRWIEDLRNNGYISTVRTPYGVTVSVNKAKKIFGKKNSDTPNMAQPDPPEMAHQYDKNGTSNKTVQKTVKEYIKEKTEPQATASVEYLKNPPEGYITKLCTEYSIPEPFILEEKDKCLNYLAYKGKRYKDYNLFFRNWVRNSWQRLPDWKKNIPTVKIEDGERWSTEKKLYEYYEGGRVIKELKTDEELSEFLKTKGVNFVIPPKIKPGDYVFKAPTTEEIQEKIKTGERKIWNF